jgi:hypothetical protein
MAFRKTGAASIKFQGIKMCLFPANRILFNSFVAFLLLSTASVSHAAVTVYGVQTNLPEFGSAVVGLGDLNRDGYDDFAVTRSTNQGLVRIYSGYSQPYNGSNPLLIAELNGNAAGESIGKSIASLGDINNDGVPDFIVGVTTSTSDFLRAYSGKDLSILYTTPLHSIPEDFARSLASMGDQNGDGKRDILVGAPSDSTGGGTTNYQRGRVWVLSGANGQVLGQVAGPTANSAFGSSLAEVGDVNGDRISDFVVGSPAYGSGAGRADVILGNTLSSLHFVSRTQAYGTSVSGVGDITGDGVPDFAVGSSSNAVGDAYSGASGTLLFGFKGVQGEPFGGCVGKFRDINHDGKPDILVGRYSGAYPTDYAIVASGADGSMLAQLATAGWGSCPIASAGDVTGDDNSEIIAGSRSLGSNGAGRFSVISLESSIVKFEAPGTYYRIGNTTVVF